MTELTSFWARRRAAVAAEEKAEQFESERVQKEEALVGKTDAEILEELGLPDPATLQAGDDFSGFMATGVPEHLKRVALRTLWRSNPVLACVDGLNEYDDDYRAAMLLSEPVKTAYQVGKGMKAHLDEMARKAALEETEAPANSPEDAHEDAPVAAFDDAGGVETIKEEAHDETVPLFDECEEGGTSPLPRRMRFHFEEAHV